MYRVNSRLLTTALKKLTSALAALLSCVFAAVVAAAPPPALPPLLVATTATAPPFASRDDDGQLVGFNVDVAKAICEKIGRECRVDAYNFPEILPLVAAGKVDIGFGNYLRTPEREKQVLFSIPYWRSTSSFVGKAGYPLPPFDEIKDHHTLCLTRGSQQLRFISRLPGRDDAIFLTDTNQAAFDGLLHARCSLLLLPTMQALSFLKQPAGAPFSFIGKPLDKDGLGGDVCIIVSPGNPDLLKKVNQAIQELMANGTHERMSRRYFPFKIF